jgi:hypothetical protein
MQHVHVELLRILQERKVHFGFRQQAAVNDPGRNGDRVQLGITV